MNPTHGWLRTSSLSRRPARIGCRVALSRAFQPSDGGWGEPDFAPRAVESTAAEATRREFANSSTKEVVWRARADGTLELARRHRARVELYTVSLDGTPQLVATSERSRRAIAALVCACGAAGVGFGTWVATGGEAWAFGLFAGLLVFGGILAGRIDRGLLVRAWLRERFGTDEDWVIVPHKFDGAPATGNQLIAIGGPPMPAGKRRSSGRSTTERSRSRPNAIARSTCIQSKSSAASRSSIDSTCAACGRSARSAENGRSGTGSRPRWRPGTDERRQATLSPNGAAQESNLPSVGLRRRTGFEDQLGHQPRPLRRGE